MRLFDVNAFSCFKLQESGYIKNLSETSLFVKNFEESIVTALSL